MTPENWAAVLFVNWTRDGIASGLDAEHKQGSLILDHAWAIQIALVVACSKFREVKISSTRQQSFMVTGVKPRIG